MKLWFCYCAIVLLLCTYVSSKQFHFSKFRMYNLMPLTEKGVKILQRWHDQFPQEPDPATGLTFMNHPRINGKTDILVPPKLKSVFRGMLAAVSESDISIVHYVPNFSRNVRQFENQLRSSRIQRRKRSIDDLVLSHRTYLRYNEIMDALVAINRKCNVLSLGTCNIETIGVTYENRRLAVLKITKFIPGKQKRKVWVDGGIHAREWISPANVLYIADSLVSRGLAPQNSLSKELADLLNEFDFMILPLYNPDGYEFAHSHFRFWRKNREPNPGNINCVGVDLNRNYGFKFGGVGSSSDPCQDNYHGPVAFSAKENDAVRQFIEREHGLSATSFIFFLSYHSYGQYILMPFGYQVRTYPNDKTHFKMKCAAFYGAQRMYNKNHRFYIHGTSADVLYQAAGGSDDWAHGQMKIPYSMTIELPDDGAYGFLLPPSYIVNVGEESVAGVVSIMKTIVKLEKNDAFYNAYCPRFH